MTHAPHSYGGSSPNRVPRPPRLYIETLDHGYLSTIREGLQWIDLGSKVKRGDTVFIKPNLTFPYFRKGVMTNPECVEALVIAISDYTDRIIIGEADSGGYNRFCIDDVLAKTGITRLQDRYGIRVVNLSHLPRRPQSFRYKGRTLHVPLPTMLLDDIDLFVTVPVPKIHMNTGVSIAIKNQWGCIPEPSARLGFHPFFEKVIYEVNQSLQPSIAIVDGKYGLNRSGPMLGDVIDLNWLMVSDNIYTNDVAVCRLMQIHPKHVYYLNYLIQNEVVQSDLRGIQVNQSLEAFVREKFYLRRAWTDYPGLLAFKSPLLSYVAYYSPLANLLHKVLYLFRRPFYDYDAPERTEPLAGDDGAAI